MRIAKPPNVWTRVRPTVAARLMKRLTTVHKRLSKRRAALDVFNGLDLRVSVSSMPRFFKISEAGAVPKWVSAQAFALRHWGQPISPTCKGSTERDFIWLSPEAQCLCRQVQVLDIFHEHSTVAVDLSLDVPLNHTFRWPRKEAKRIGAGAGKSLSLVLQQPATPILAISWRPTCMGMCVLNLVEAFFLCNLAAANVRRLIDIRNSLSFAARGGKAKSLCVVMLRPTQ